MQAALAAATKAKAEADALDAIGQEGDDEGSPVPAADGAAAPASGPGGVVVAGGSGAGVVVDPKSPPPSSTAITTVEAAAAAAAGIATAATADDSVVIPKKKKPAKIPKIPPKIAQLNDDFVSEITPDICADIFKRLINEWQVEIKPPLMPSKIPPEPGEKTIIPLKLILP